MRRALHRSPVADDRIAVARAWLEARRPGEEVLIVGATTEAAHTLVRSVVARRGAIFGWHRASLASLAATLARQTLAVRGLAPAGAFAHEALAARVLDALGREGSLGRFAGVAGTPRLPRAIARTLDELRMAHVARTQIAPHDPTLARALEATDDARAERLADRADVLAIATQHAADPRPRALLGWPTLLLDVPVATAAERALLCAVVARSDDVIATVPDGDERSLRALEVALATAAQSCEPDTPADESTPLRRVARFLFAREPGPSADATTAVTVLSAPGERRECTEIARELLREAASGAALDRIAILLHRPALYRDHLEQALRRAGIPAHFAKGTSRPHPAGRALLALLACAAEGLSARRFAEYLSLAELPSADVTGAPPQAAPEWVPPDEEIAEVIAGSRDGLVDARDDDTDAAFDDDATHADPRDMPVLAGSLRAPRRWEQLLVDAAVIGGRDRWARRLDGLDHSFERALGHLDDPAGPDGDRLRARRAELAALRRFAMPLLETLHELHTPASWGEWIARLSALSARALRRPERVLASLAQLWPMASIGPVGLAEVRRVLAPRLAEIVTRVSGPTFGRVLVAPIAAARGRSFDVVFVPGLAERLFPSKLSEDPILRDAARRVLSSDLATEDDRRDAERLALRLCVGAARRRVVISFPRIDLEQTRPRVPSFYGLDVLRAAEGRLPGLDELSRRAEQAAHTRIGWPAPASSIEAIDEAELDLALLDVFFRQPEEQSRGAASYLLHTNPHLARALRARGRRWRRRWLPNDGLVRPSSAGLAALAAHGFDRRAFSATALERYARCPYSFFLNTVHRLRPREMPEAIEELDPLSRGLLTHQVQFRTLVTLRERGWLPITDGVLDDALAVLEAELDEVARQFRDELAPAIARVWDDGVSAVRADLREWLHLTAKETKWVPSRFELSFGLPAEHRDARDASSRDEPVELPVGIRLRGSIDLVEQAADGAMRATDHKTGKARVPEGAVVYGGLALQPLLYAMALEVVFPDCRVDSGRLAYCTVRGGFEERVIALDDCARDDVRVVLETVRRAIETGFLPAAPARGECKWCDYARVCGPNEEQRVAIKPKDLLEPLVRLRRMP